MTNETKKILKMKKRKKRFILLSQIGIIILFIISWEILANKKIVNPFIFSSPSRIINTLWNLTKTGEIFGHILTTLYETMIAFTIGISLGFIIAIILY